MQTDSDYIEKEIPLFPLNVVLFPGGVLPLHIFEERYRAMMKFCIRHESPFGIVMIKEGEEGGEAPIPHKIGTAVDLLEVDRFPDGRMNIMTSGQYRFEILEEISEEEPYLVARVRVLDAVDAEPDPTLESIAKETHALYKEYETLSSDLLFRWQTPEEKPLHPQQLAYQIGTRLRIPLEAKQTLLETVSFEELLQREQEILKLQNKRIGIRLAARNN